MTTPFRCPLCHRDTYHRLFSSRDRMFGLPGRFIVVRCQSCSLVLLNPRLANRELASYYPSKKYYSYKKPKKYNFFVSLRSYLITHYYKPTFISRVISLFIQKVPAIPHQRSKGKILDIGCGNGDTLLNLKTLGWETYGLDIDAKAIALSRKYGVDDARVGSYTEVRLYPDRYFDAIRLYHVIEHLDDPFQCLTLIRRKLKPEGELIIGTPNVASIVSRVFGTYWYNLDSPRHLYLFSPITLGEMIKHAGFTVQSVEFCSAGGFLGSIQYVLSEKFHINVDLIHQTWLVMLFYPLEWMIDKIGLGDVFVLRAKR